MSRPNDYDTLIKEAEQKILLDLDILKSKTNILKMLKSTNDSNWDKTHTEALRALNV